MCGLAGFVDYSPGGHDRALSILRLMTESVAHRGPDADGYWIDDEARVALGHRRLSIIDLTETGAQPMTSRSGRYTIIYNGEIYGFLELRRELERKGVVFVGHSDTEVLLAAVDEYGFENTLERCNGMFAFALYDRQTRQILFARDRLGKKPMYIGLAGRSVLFGSELKVLRAHHDFSAPEIDRGAVSLYLRHNYIPAPYSIYSNVMKLPAGTWLAISVDTAPPSIDAVRDAVRAYWSPYEAIGTARAERIESESESLDRLENVLLTAVREHIVSDVPVGVFLSGGIDSSLIVALMQEVSATRVKTFTMGFDEQEHNEAEVAAQVAAHLNTDHTELTATSQMALGLIDRLPVIYDEPFADPSQVPTILISSLARENVTVALSGDGGDESFGGYSRYHQMITIDTLARRVPGLAFRAAERLPTAMLDMALKLGRNSFPRSLRDDVSGDRIKKLAEILKHEESDRRYLEFVTGWNSPEKIVIDGYEPMTAIAQGPVPDALGPIERMMYRDTIGYLPDDVLVKVDRASMAFGLETRSPLLDYRVVEEAWRAPRSLIMDDTTGKVALRRLLARRVPEQLLDRPKQGFGVPINDWLRGPLREWAGDMLSSRRLEHDGLFRPQSIEKRWREHTSGDRQWGPHLWTILMFNAWHDHWSGPVQRSSVT